jgi:hypothetical protein
LEDAAMKNAIVLFAVLLGCAGSAYAAQVKTAPKGGTAIDPCSLVTKQEAVAAVGESVADGKSTIVDTSTSPAMQGGGSCVFDSPSTPRYLKVNMYRYTPQIAAMYRSRCAKKETVSGIGDVACWYDSKHAELQLIKGVTSLAIQLNRSGDATAALKTVAKKAADRLP